MQEFAGLTAQDFRDAWPQAYRQAISQVALLMQVCEEQFTRATAQAMWSERVATAATEELRATQSTLTHALERATHDGHQHLRGLAQVVEDKTKDLIRREQALADARVEHDRRMRANMVALRTNYLQFVDAPITTRMRWAFGSRAYRLQFLVKKDAEAPK